MNINKTWRSFLNENLDTFDTYRKSLKVDDKGKVKLYHVSGTSDITEFDPAISAESKNIFSRREYRIWDRPRVFFFTEVGQEDPGIGRIPGDVAYVSEIDFDKLYPIHEDPLGLSREEKYEEFQKLTGLDKYHPRFLNPYERAAVLAEERGYIGFLYKHSGTNDIIAAVWKKIPAKKLEDSFYKN